jgi:hypothetical protein
LEIGFIDHFNTRLVTTLKYSAIADLHTSQIITAHAIFFSLLSLVVSLVTAYNIGGSSTTPTKSSLHRLPYNSITSKLVPLITSWHVPRRKHHCCTPIFPVGTCLFAKALHTNGCVYLLRICLPISRYFVVCFKVVA